MYKEWFVDLRFPGYEDTLIVDGVPEGWKKEKLIDIANIQYGFAFDGSLFNTQGKGTPIVRIRNIPNGITNDYTTKEIMRGWLLQAIYEPIKFFEKTVVGATVAHLGKKHIDTIELLTGPDELYVPFEYLFQKRQLLLNQNILLAEARDRLLSKLMSGELEV